MSCHILEGDLWRVLVVFLKELGFRLADREDATSTSHETTATHTSHDEEPDEDDDDEGSKVPKQVADEVVVPFVGDLSIEVAFFVLGVEITFEVVDGTKLHLDACGFLVLVHGTKHLLVIL